MDGRHISWPAPVVHPPPLARGTKREINEIHSQSFATGVAIARRSLSSPPPVFRSPPPRPISIRSIGSPPPVSGASGRAHNTVSVRPAAPVVTRSPVTELFHPRQAMVVQSPSKSGPVPGALVPRPCHMAAPSRHHNSGDLTEGCPNWAVLFLGRAVSGSTVHQEKVQTVRAIEAASLRMDTDPVLVDRWRAHWASAGITNTATLQLVWKQSMLGYTAAYINWARCAIT